MVFLPSGGGHEPYFCSRLVSFCRSITSSYSLRRFLNRSMAHNEAAPSRPGVQLKTPKGTRDWVGQDLLLREHML